MRMNRIEVLEGEDGAGVARSPGAMLADSVGVRHGFGKSLLVGEDSAESAAIGVFQQAKGRA